MFKHRVSKPQTAEIRRRTQPAAQVVGMKRKTVELGRGEKQAAKKSLEGLLTIALLALTLLCSIPRLGAQSSDLPPGPAQAKLRTACLECHDASIIVQQRLSKPAWTREVDKMIKWGALVEAADRDSFIDYLSTNFPPDRAPAEMPRTASAKKR
jgi:hypothetical protein